MKKSISAILVAALMLFAFTACEQQPINWPQEITGISAVKTGDITYLEGEAFDFRGLQIVANYKDGTTAPVEQSALTVDAPSVLKADNCMLLIGSDHDVLGLMLMCMNLGLSGAIEGHIFMSRCSFVQRTFTL